ncbi:hypothetical protein LguiB_028247 [Lonicera macranthoides]
MVVHGVPNDDPDIMTYKDKAWKFKRNSIKFHMLDSRSLNDNHAFQGVPNNLGVEIQQRHQDATGYLPFVFDGSLLGAGKFGDMRHYKWIMLSRSRTKRTLRTLSQFMTHYLQQSCFLSGLLYSVLEAVRLELLLSKLSDLLAFSELVSQYSQRGYRSLLYN